MFSDILEELNIFIFRIKQSVLDWRQTHNTPS